MYGRGVEDPDGHVREPAWTDPEATTDDQAGLAVTL